MRLIDADVLIAELNESHFPGAPYVDAGISLAIGKVLDAPTIEPEQRWIPVSERLPDEGVHILISIPDGVTYGWFNGCYFIQDVSHNSKRLRVVEAWQPLPEQYRGEGKQNG